MSLDITPSIAVGKQVVQGYGEGVFRIANTEHSGSIIVMPDRTVAWGCESADGLSVNDLSPLTGAAEIADIDILIVGCGPRFTVPPQGLRQVLKSDHGLILEWMDTGAACRTFNVLLAEERRVAAALIALT